MKSKYLIALPFFLLSLTGCSFKKGADVYSDKPAFNDGDLSFEFSKVSGDILSDNYSLYITLDVVNKNTKSTTISFDEGKITKESNNAEYTVSGPFSKKYNLECDIKYTATFTSVLPTSIKADQYVFYLKYNSKEIRFHLYETPDELREKIEVKYIVDGNQVNTIKVPKGRYLPSYCWVSENYIYGCQEWYLDNKATNGVTSEYVVNEPITLYGYKQEILKYSESSNNFYVKGYNFIPSSGEIVIPRTYHGKTIYSILAGAFNLSCAGLKSIYIPKNTRISGTYNFSYCVDLEYVYFEGSESEWESVNEASYPIMTKIVFNTYK